MDQEILLILCKALIEEKTEKSLFYLKTQIVDNEDVIIDKPYFYGEVMTMLAANLLAAEVSDKDLGSEVTLSNLSCKKLEYIEKFAEDLAALYYHNTNINEAIKKLLEKLCQYDCSQINSLIIRLAEKPELKEAALEELSNMGLYCHNTDLVTLVIEKRLFNNDKTLDSLIAKLKTVNFAAQIEFEKLGRYRSEADQNEKVKTEKKIEEIKQEHHDIAQAIMKVFNHLGKTIQPRNEFFHNIICRNEELNMDFYNLFANIDDYDTSALDFIDVANCLSWGNSETLVHLLISMNKLPREGFGYLKSINEIVNNIFLERKKDDAGLEFDKEENQFLEDVLESHAIYNLSAINLVKIVEYLYGDIKHIPSERVKELRAKYESDYNPANDGKLADEMMYVVKPLTESYHNEKTFFEELLIELLSSKYSAHYEQSILKIIEDNATYLDMNYNHTSSTIHGSCLPYAICTYGSDTVIRAVLKEHELPMYISPNIFSSDHSTDLVHVYARLGEYDKALEVFNNPRYVLVDPGEEDTLSEDGRYDMDNVELYQESLSSIIQVLCDKKDKNSINFLNQILYSPKLTLINAKAFESLNFFYRNALNLDQDEADTLLKQISEYLRRRIENDELRVFVVSKGFTPNLRHEFTGLRLATWEEVEGAFSRLNSNNKVIKLGN